MKRQVWFILLLFLLWIPVTSAQSDTMLAFLNGSGQLVVSTGDGVMRWIVTNPGQMIDQTWGFNWTEDGELVFAIRDAGIFVGDPDSQSITPVDADNLQLLSHLRGLGNRPNITQPQGTSPDGDFAFIWDGTNYAIVDLTNNTQQILPLTGERYAQGSGLWSDNAPLVAYWGMENGTTALSVVHPPNTNSATLSSGRSAPMLPITWQPDTNRLIFRSATGDVVLADVDCLTSSCDANPLETSIIVAPSSANHIQATESRLYYVDGEQLITVDLSCTTDNSCLESRQPLGENVAPLTMMQVQGDHLVYTRYTSDPTSPTDRIINLLDITCVPECQPQPILIDAIAGLLSPSGDYLMLDSVSAGLNILDIESGALVYLTETMGGQLGSGLNTARWR